MSYGLSRNTGHGRRARRYRYSPDLRRDGPGLLSEAQDSRSRPGPYSRGSRAAARRTHVPSKHEQRLAPIFEGLFHALGIEDPDYFPGPEYAKAGMALIQLSLFLLFGGATLVGYGVFALAELAANRLRKAKADARRGDLAARKALHVLHDHARHRPPTAEMLRKYWLASRRSLEGRLLLGSLMGDLSVTVDASYVRGDDGEIVGRQGGIKGWMERNAPDMMRHYKTLMHYKAVADKFRLYCGPAVLRGAGAGRGGGGAGTHDPGACRDGASQAGAAPQGGGTALGVPDDGGAPRRRLRRPRARPGATTDGVAQNSINSRNILNIIVILMREFGAIRAGAGRRTVASARWRPFRAGPQAPRVASRRIRQAASRGAPKSDPPDAIFIGHRLRPQPPLLRFAPPLPLACLRAAPMCQPLDRHHE